MKKRKSDKVFRPDDDLAVILHSKTKQTTLAPKPKTHTITYIEKDLMTGKVEAVKRYTIPDRE